MDTMGTPARTITKGLALVFLSIVAALVIIEGTLAITGIAATAVKTQPVDPTSPYRHAIPDHNYIYAKGPFAQIRQTHKTNNYGFKTNIVFDKHSPAPKILYIGGSLVIAEQVAQRESSGSLLNESSPYEIYPIAAERPVLSQHLAYAHFGINEFSPEKIIFLLANTTFEDSLLTHAKDRGKHYFDAKNDYELALVNYFPHTAKSIIRKSRLANYLFKNIGIRYLFKPPRILSPKTKSQAALATHDKKREEMAGHAKQAFLDGLEKLDIPPSNILFVFSQESPLVYDLKSRPADHPFSILAQELRNRGYQVLDLHEPFLEHYRTHGERFDFEIDSHWNVMANKLAADAIKNTGFVNTNK